MSPHFDFVPKQIKILAEYFSKIDQNILPSNGQIILGSFGRLEGKFSSDLDPWIICPTSKVLELSLLDKIAKNELKIRQNLAKKYKVTNLARHYASIFTPQEAGIYAQTFITRVLNPHKHEEHAIHGQDHLAAVDIPTTLQLPDLYVSLSEFEQNYQKTSDPEIALKWLLRIIKELLFQHNRQYRPITELLEVYRSTYHDDPDQVIAASQKFRLRLSHSISTEDISRIEILHSLMWTLEKVRWEIISSYKAPDHFDSWRLGKKSYFGFSPREIGNLIHRYIQITNLIPTGTKSIGLSLIDLCRPQTTLSLTDFHRLLSNWIITAAQIILNPSSSSTEPNLSIIIPTISNHQPSITRIATDAGTRFIKSEILALQQFCPQNIISTSYHPNVCSLTTKDYLSPAPTPAELASLLPSYASHLKQLHRHKVNYFGRLGSRYRYRSYDNYLLARIKTTPLSPELAKKLTTLTQINSSLLRKIKPTLCHMDPGPQNLILKDGELNLIDFEHASGCHPYWDVSRVINFLEPPQSVKFHKSYFSDHHHPSQAELITELVMLATFLSHPNNHTFSQKKKFQTKLNSLIRQAEG